MVTVIAVLVVLASFGPWLLAALLVVLTVPAWRSLVATGAEQLELARQEGAVVAARADRQQAQVLAGDERGVYGEFPPVNTESAPVVSGQR